jgi:hypothetical protein
MPRGGRRPGAGLPKGFKFPKTLEKEAAKRELQERVIAEIGPMVTGLLESAKGAYAMFAKSEAGWVQVTDEQTMLRCLQSGESFYRIEQRKPDVRAAQELLHQTIGEPQKSVAVTGGDGGPVRVVHVLYEKHVD